MRFEVNEGMAGLPLPKLGAVLVVVGAGYWLAQAVAFVRTRRAVPQAESLTASPPAVWPRVSLIVPARNEAATVEAALRSKLSGTYPDLEVVLINDRSTDGTGELAETVARSDARVRVVHMTTLPDGWLGKVHALHVGQQRATGEWLLFSDADVHVRPGTLEKVIATAEREHVDHVTVLPRITSSGLLLQPALTTFFRLLGTGARLWAVADPRSSAAAGIGAFSLVRRTALSRSPGFEWLRMETADDAALGHMLKHSGARQRVYNGRSCVSLQFYPSFRAMVTALEKNGASLPMPGLIVAACVLVALEWSPVLGLVLLGGPSKLVAVAVWVLASALSWTSARWGGLRAWPSVIPFFGVLPLLFAMIRSAALARHRGAVVWRGTAYPLEVIRSGLRLRATGKYLPPPQ